MEHFPADFLSRYHTHILCQRGYSKFKFNDVPFQCNSGEFIFWLAGSEVSELTFSENFISTVFLVEKDFLLDNLPNLNLGIDAVVHHKVNPILHIDDKKDKEKVLKNFQSLYLKSQETTHRFYDEVLKLQMQLFILEMWSVFLEQFAKDRRTVRHGSLYEQFLQLVEENCMVEREVKFYSDKLHITPKYLNQICKVNTGMTASHWVQRYTKERIIVLLRNKDLHIAEIADEMGFSSRSFFTRYVKKLIGVTPSEYRDRIQLHLKK